MLCSFKNIGIILDDGKETANSHLRFTYKHDIGRMDKKMEATTRFRVEGSGVGSRAWGNGLTVKQALYRII